MTENTQAVSSLQGAVTDLKTNNASLATTIQDEQTKGREADSAPGRNPLQGCHALTDRQLSGG